MMALVLAFIANGCAVDCGGTCSSGTKTLGTDCDAVNTSVTVNSTCEFIAPTAGTTVLFDAATQFLINTCLYTSNGTSWATRTIFDSSSATPGDGDWTDF